MTRPLTLLSLLITAALVSTAAAEETEKKEEHTIKLGKDKIELKAPGEWETIKPKFAGIIDYEFSVSPAEGDEAPGRVTIGGAGGGVDPNINRWIGQFEKAKSSRDESKVAEQTVYSVDVNGDYKEGSPFGAKTLRENYRLLAVIIATEKLGTYYVKFVGPRKTIAANEEAFQKLVKSLKVSE